MDIIELKRNIKDTLSKSNVLDTVSNDIDQNADFSLKHLKNNLKDTLKKSGVLNTVKAQIRQEFIKGLANIEKENVYQATTLTLNDRILLSVVYHFLHNRKLIKTISVLIAECGIDPKYSILTENDLSKMIKFNNISNTYDSLKSNNHKSHPTNGLLLLPDEIIKQNKTSILDLLIYCCFTINDYKKEVSCQTDFTGPSIREFLDDEIQNIHHKYRLNREKELLQPNKTIEERMIAFQRDCEKRMLQDLTIQVNHIRENEINRVRLEEIQKSRIAIETMRKEIDHEYNRRLQVHIDRENASAQRLSEQEHQTQRSLYETRQLMQREADEWRSREAAATRKQNLESQGIRLMELRLHEAQSMIEIRERNISQREKELDEKNKMSRDQARKEALATVQSELDILSRERSTLMLERKRFEDEKASQSMLLDSAKSIREQLHKTLDELQQKEDEIVSMNRMHQRMIKYQEDEETIRKDNKDLELISRELQMKFEYEKRSLLMEQDQLQNNLSIERSRIVSYKHKLEELSLLVHDKSKTIESLQKQLNNQKKNATVNNNNGNNNGNSSERRNNLNFMIDNTINKNRINSKSIRNKHIDELLKSKYNDHSSIYVSSNMNNQSITTSAVGLYPYQHNIQETKAALPSNHQLYDADFDNVIERISHHKIQSLLPSSSISLHDTTNNNYNTIHLRSNSTNTYHPLVKNNISSSHVYLNSNMILDNNNKERSEDQLVDKQQQQHSIKLNTKEYIHNENNNNGLFQSKKQEQQTKHKESVLFGMKITSNTNNESNKYYIPEEKEGIDLTQMTRNNNIIPISNSVSNSSSSSSTPDVVVNNKVKNIEIDESFARDSLEQVILKYSDTSNLEPLVVTNQPSSMFVTSIDSTIYKNVLPIKQNVTLNNNILENTRKVDLLKDGFVDYSTENYNKQITYDNKSKKEVKVQLSEDIISDEEEVPTTNSDDNNDDLRWKQQTDDDDDDDDDDAYPLKQKEQELRLQQQQQEELRLKQQQEELRLKQQQQDKELRLQQQQDEELRLQQQQQDKELRLQQQQQGTELRLKQQQDTELRLKQQQDDDDDIAYLLKQQKEELRLKQQKDEELRWKQQQQEQELRLKQQQDEELRLKQQKDEELRLKQQKDEELRLQQQKEDKELRLQQQQEQELRLKQQKDDDDKAYLLKQQQEEELRLKQQQDEKLRLKRQQEQDDDDEGDILDYAAIRRNALARRKNSLLSQSLPSLNASYPVASLSSDVSTVGTINAGGELTLTRQSVTDITNTSLNDGMMNHITGVTSSVDTQSLPIKRNIGKDFLKTLQDGSDSDISETRIEIADQSDEVSDNWG